MKRSFKIVVLGTITCFLILLLSSTMLLTTSVGIKSASKWANSNVNGLLITGIDGSWMTGVTIDSLSFDNASVNMELHSLNFEPSMSCLLSLKICLDEVSLSRIILSQKKSVAPAQLIELPTAIMPIPIGITNLTVNEFILNSNLTITQLTAKSIRWWGTQLKVDSLSASYQNHTVETSGDLYLIGNYKLNFNAQLSLQELPLLSTALPPLSVALSGSLASLNWSVESSEQSGIVSSGWVKALRNDLPFNAFVLWDADSPLTISVNENTTTDLSYAKVNLSGNLNTPDKSPQIKFNGEVFASRLQISTTQLVDVNSLISGNFINKVVTITQAEIIKNRKRNLARPINPTTLVNAKSAANATQKPVTDSVSMTGTINLGEETKWQISGVCQKCSADEFLFRKTSITLSGEFSIVGHLTKEEIISTVASNQLFVEHLGRKNPLNGKIIIEATMDNTAPRNLSPAKLTVDNLSLSMGNDSVSINGSFPNSVVDLKFSLNEGGLNELANDFQSVIAIHKVTANGEVTVDSRRTAPIVSGNMAIKEAQINDILIQELNADLKPLANSRYALTTNATEVSHTELIANEVQINAQGTADNFAFSAQAHAQSLGSVQLDCLTQITTGTVDLQCNKLKLKLLYETLARSNLTQWTLQTDLTANINLDEASGTVQPFCIQPKNSVSNGRRATEGLNTHANDETICLTTPASYSPTVGLRAFNVSADAIAWSRINPWLPTGFTADGQWSAQLNDVSLSKNNELTASATLDSTDTQWTWLVDKTTPIQFSAPSIKANLSINDKDITATAAVHTDTLGELDISLSPLYGNGHRIEVKLKRAKLALINALYPVTDEIDGDIEAVVQFDYKQAIENMNGSIAVRNSTIKAYSLPFTLSKIYIDGTLKNNTIALNGSFAVDQANGKLAGELVTKNNEITGDISLQAADIIYAISPDIWFVFDPDLHLRLEKKSLFLSGSLPIKKARIFIEELPEQAVDVSSDAVIVGEDIKATALALNAELAVILGDDVRFTGFGLETKLSGDLIISQKPSEATRGRGVIVLSNGAYQAYGQDLAIKAGKLIFSGNLLNPDVDIKAIRNNTPEQIEVGVLLQGELSEPALELFSQPAMSEEHRIYYLLTGEAPGASSLDSKVAAQQAAITLALDRSNRRTGKFAGSLGIEDFRIGTGQGANGQEIQVSGKITPDLYLRYGYDLVDQSNSVTARYHIFENMYLELFNGARSAVDLLWLFSIDEEPILEQ